ncbi:MAG: mandelate racemase/muconate lactonizing enzyme family protein [Oscillospiraceae bacterium]|jgi:galactonate dehydratase|nr:mandelate racemase/muconate lactonizing enzyme family protein [Oscillospiraceae bacterium]
MKITDVKTYVTNPGYRNFVYVKILTDEGIHGIGEAYSIGPDLATVKTIEYFKDWLIGEDPTRVEYLWTKLYNYSRFPGGSILYSALSGIDFALWDITAKSLGVPVYKLFGGPTRDKVWLYGKPVGKTHEALVECALAERERYGFSAIKTFLPFLEGKGPSIKRLENNFSALRNALGDDYQIAIDFHARVLEPATALTMAQVIEPMHPFFIEEPLKPENMGMMAALKAKMKAPLATGECLYTKFEFNDLIKADAADILQPDLFVSGGFTEGRKIAAMAEANYKNIAPHHPVSPLATYINVHFALSISNFLILEFQNDDVPGRRELLTDVLKVNNGYIDPPTAPGWGVELNEAYIEAHPYKSWTRPFIKNHDGSIGIV